MKGHLKENAQEAHSKTKHKRKEGDERIAILAPTG